MAVDSQVQLLIEGMSAGEVPQFADLGHVAVREMCESMLLPFDSGNLASVKDIKIPVEGVELAARLYTPECDGDDKRGTDKNNQEKLPLIVYFHGGGWTIGSLETHDPICRGLAVWSGCIVVSVYYRLSPEHPFPVPLEDCYAATCWLENHGGEFGADTNRLAVAGDSAGGNLAAEVCLLARDRKGPRLSGQLLFYPIVDCNFATDSYRENAEGYVMRASDMRWFWDQYISEPAERDNALACPLKAELHDLPPALVVTAEYDVLRDEGNAYAEKLRQAGVSVEHEEVLGMVHGFVGFAALVDKGKNVLQKTAISLGGKLGS